MLEGLIITGGSIFLSIIGYIIRVEHRFTRIETKIDLLLNGNPRRKRRKV